MAERFHIRHEPARGILSRTSGFIAEAGFTHSLTPARNCTFACTYCYVPTMRVQGGLKPEDWRRWGQFTTFKTNAADLVAGRRRGGEVVYCSPLVDPYQPAEEQEAMMPRVLGALIENPPALFTIQTRGPLIVRDLELLARLNERTRLRVSFTVTTDREDVRRWYEPHCAPNEERLETIRRLTAAGIRTFVTLAPILPCNPETLAQMALEASREDVIGDPFHVRAVKRHGATTRPEAERVSAVRGFEEWHDPAFQRQAITEIGERVAAAGRRFAVGPEAFRWLAQ
ncbi:MAG: radical SAM protein [Bryobacteraceae bacterium]